MIRVFSWDGIQVEDLGYDTIANFNAIRHLTKPCEDSTCRGGFSIEGCENHVYMAVLV